VVGNGRNSPAEILIHSSRMIEEKPRTVREEPSPSETTSNLRTGCNDIHWLASCTKLVTGITCMQLVEHGNLRLDDSDQVEKLCPELSNIKVLQEDGSLVEKENCITLRMLMTHTGKYILIITNIDISINRLPQLDLVTHS
jgi:hypothetical protein